MQKMCSETMFLVNQKTFLMSVLMTLLPVTALVVILKLKTK